MSISSLATPGNSTVIAMSESVSLTSVRGSRLVSTAASLDSFFEDDKGPIRLLLKSSNLGIPSGPVVTENPKTNGLFVELSETLPSTASLIKLSICLRILRNSLSRFPNISSIFQSLSPNQSPSLLSRFLFMISHYTTYSCKPTVQ